MIQPATAGPWVQQKQYANVLGRKMAYIERGAGQPIVFLHGNPTSSYLWRKVMPHVEAPGLRLIAPDLMGMGDSEKVPAGAESDRYRFAGHARYLEAFLDRMIGPAERVVLVLHDWGGALGFDWAHHHQDRVRGLAYMETFVRPLELADLPESFHSTLNAVRSDDGLRLVLEENMFIENMLPSLIERTLTPEEMAEYRRPYLTAGEDRMPTLQFAREVPLSAKPADVAERMAAYSAWLQSSSLPKLFFEANPGVFIRDSVRDLARSFPNEKIVNVNGLHFLPEDCPDTIGATVSDWLETVLEKRVG